MRIDEVCQTQLVGNERHLIYMVFLLFGSTFCVMMVVVLVVKGVCEGCV